MLEPVADEREANEESCAAQGAKGFFNPPSQEKPLHAPLIYADSENVDLEVMTEGDYNKCEDSLKMADKRDLGQILGLAFRM